MRFHVGMVLATVVFWVSESVALSCYPAGPYRCHIPTASVAFVGTAISKQNVDLRPALNFVTNSRARRVAGDPAPPRDESYIAVTFQVNEPLRGDIQKTMVIRTAPANSSANYPFKVGEDYLVFADMTNGALTTNSCLGTRPAADEAALIRQLRAARIGAPMADIFGLVRSPRTIEGTGSETLDQALTVTAQSDRGEYRTHTAIDGTYEFWAVPPGRYAITVQPPSRRSASQAHALDVGLGIACRADFEIAHVGRISGKVSNSRGQPVSGVLAAFPAGMDPRTGAFVSASIDDGRFDLRQVPPGRYRLRLMLQLNGRLRSNEVYYYPGTRLLTDALEVEVGDGSYIDGLHFNIP